MPNAVYKFAAPAGGVTGEKLAREITQQIRRPLSVTREADGGVAVIFDSPINQQSQATLAAIVAGHAGDAAVQPRTDATLLALIDGLTAEQQRKILRRMMLAFLRTIGDDQLEKLTQNVVNPI